MKYVNHYSKDLKNFSKIFILSHRANNNSSTKNDKKYFKP